jgi:alanine racemase
MNPSQIPASLDAVDTPNVPADTARLTVDLSALEANYREFVRRASPAAVAPVVKADAYSLGMSEVAKKLSSLGADTFFVARLEEGIALRETLPRARIFLFDGLVPGAASQYAAHRLTPVLNTLEEIAEWSEYGRQTRAVLDAALQIDTGMNRSGLSNEDVSALAANRRSAFANIRLSLIMSHLACADELEHPLNNQQLERFRAALGVLPVAPASLAATAGIDLGRDYLFDIVRPGLGLYGGNPRVGRANPYTHVVHLNAKILQVRDLKEGETVGYGATFTASKPTRLAVVPIGYADGLIRAVGPHGYAAIGGTRVPFAGRISMDLATLNVTGLPSGECERGTEVEFLGKTISLEDLAFAAGTINHEVLTSLSPRAVRVYLK